MSAWDVRGTSNPADDQMVEVPAVGAEGGAPFPGLTPSSRRRLDDPALTPRSRSAAFDRATGRRDGLSARPR